MRNNSKEKQSKQQGTLKKITKLNNKLIVTSKILQKSLSNVWLASVMEGQGGGFPPCLLNVGLHMASAFGH